MALLNIILIVSLIDYHIRVIGESDGKSIEEAEQDNDMPDPANSHQDLTEELRGLVDRSLSTLLMDSDDGEAMRNFPYRLFYGQWVITEWMGGCSRFGRQSAEEPYVESMIGATIRMEPGLFNFNNEFSYFAPRYHIAIIPQNPEPYFAFFPSAADLDIDTPFFVFVHLNLRSLDETLNRPRHPNQPHFIGFLIKDDSTLYLFDIIDVFKLERVSHLSDKPGIFNVAP
jgi:hypothetical protein